MSADLEDLEPRDRLDEVADEREQLMRVLRTIRSECLRKTVGSGRVDDDSNDAERIKYLNTAIRSVAEERRLLEDQESDDIVAEFASLRDEIDGQQGGPFFQ
jgi:hypothetical protein